MYIENLSLLNYKNYEEISVPLHKKVNCFVGDNGVGKTNLLDAVHYLCMCKSYFHSSDLYSIRNGQDFMVLQANFIHNDNNDEIYCGLKNGKRKIFRKNKKEYSKLADHIGLFPVVMVSPSDSSLILDGSEERRRYMNAVISQFNHEYLEATIKYNKLISQRNKLLKEMGNYQGAGELLEVYDNQLIPLGELIFEQRKEFVNNLSPIFKEFYQSISQGKEQVDIRYTSQLHENNFNDLLKKQLNRDLAAQNTSAGVHKDDLELLMNDIPIKKTGSQGQQKTFLVSLKLAQFTFLKRIRKQPPILLLDDIFDKFDGNRVKQILHLVSDKNFGQIFITHTNQERMVELLLDFEDNYNLYKVFNGDIKKIEK